MNGRARSSGYDWCWVATRLAIYARDGFACVYCGHQVDEGAALSSGLSLDHVEPNGGNGPENLVTLCNECNQSKGQRAPNPLYAGRVAAAVAKPLDRARGRELAARLRPLRVMNNRAAGARRRRATEEAPF